MCLDLYVSKYCIEFTVPTKHKVIKYTWILKYMFLITAYLVGSLYKIQNVSAMEFKLESVL